MKNYMYGGRLENAKTHIGEDPLLHLIRNVANLDSCRQFGFIYVDLFL